MTQVPNTLFSVELPDSDTHAFVTEDGQVLPFTTAPIEKVFGNVRTGILGSSDLPGGWYPEAGLRSRIPGTKTITAYFIDRADLERDAERMVRLLPDVRELWLPNGEVYELYFAEREPDPRADRLVLVLFPTSPYPRHPMLDRGILNLALPTESSTPERPLFGFDPAGSMTAPLTQKRISKGALHISTYAVAEGLWGLMSAGSPVNADGTGNEGSVSLSLQEDALVGLVDGSRVQAQLGQALSTAAMLVLFGVPASSRRYVSAVLAWRGQHARLTVKSELGVSTQHITLPAPLPDLDERTLTAGIRGDGLAISGYVGEPVLLTRYPTAQEAEAMVTRGYADMSEPGLDWAIRPPNLSLELTRADNKYLELAPGETLTFDLSVRRVGGYTGGLEMTAIVGEGLTVSTAFVSQTADTDLYRVTVTAPAEAPEAPYTLFVEVVAVGADTPGSILAEVRDSFSGIVEVAAGPAIAPDATAIRRAFDPLQRRVGEMLRDSSGNGNTFSWAGLARPDIRYMGLLATGRYDAAIISDALQNPVQAQRMNGNQTFCMIWGEVAKTRPGGVMYQVAAVGSNDGVQLERAEGGFKLRTVHGAAQVLSPDTLTYTGGHPKLALSIGATEITLRDRVSGRTIKLNRPAWADAAVRTTVGAVRDANGNLSSVTRAHLLVDSVHPYTLEAPQERRNLDALLPYAPEGDVAEAADEAVGIFLWDDDRKYVNDAAPALGITAVPIGDVQEIPGGVYPQGGGAHVLIDTGLPNTEPTTAYTKLKGISSPDTVEYNAQVAFADSVRAQASAELARHKDGRPFAMIRNNDFFSTHGYAGGKPVPDETTHRLVWNPPNKSFEVWSYYSQSGRIVKSNNTYPGTLKIALGAIPRANGSNAEQTKTKNLALIICRGLVNADTDATMAALLPTG